VHCPGWERPGHLGWYSPCIVRMDRPVHWGGSRVHFAGGYSRHLGWYSPSFAGGIVAGTACGSRRGSAGWLVVAVGFAGVVAVGLGIVRNVRGPGDRPMGRRVVRTVRISGPYTGTSTSGVVYGRPLLSAVLLVVGRSLLVLTALRRADRGCRLLVAAGLRLVLAGLDWVCCPQRGPNRPASPLPSRCPTPSGSDLLRLELPSGPALGRGPNAKSVPRTGVCHWFSFASCHRDTSSHWLP